MPGPGTSNAPRGYCTRSPTTPPAEGGFDIALMLRERARNLTDPPNESGGDVQAAVPPVEDPSFVFQFDNSLQEESEVGREPEFEGNSRIDLEPVLPQDSGVEEGETPIEVEPEPVPAGAELDAVAEATAAAQEDVGFPSDPSGFDPIADSVASGRRCDHPEPGEETGEAEAAAAADASHAGRMQSVEEALGRAELDPGAASGGGVAGGAARRSGTAGETHLACESMGDRLATVRYLILLGDLKINEEDLEGSLSCFLQVLDLDPGNATAHRRWRGSAR